MGFDAVEHGNVYWSKCRTNRCNGDN